MISFPKETIVNKNIPANKFYEKVNIPAKLKNSFVNDIEKITWSNILSPNTLEGISKDDCNMAEIDIFTIKLKSENFDTEILKIIDELIPKYVIFVLEDQNFFKIFIAFKEKDVNFDINKKIFVKRYFYTDWIEEPTLVINGDTIKTIYENFIKQIATEFHEIDDKLDFREQVERLIKIDKINSEIVCLKKKLKNELQTNRQFELNRKIKILLNEIKNMKGK